MSNNFILKRVSDSEHGCFGTLLHQQDSKFIPFAVTLEPPWMGNEQNISCIPSGIYKLNRINSPKYGDVFQITEVEGRTHVLLHWGNLVENTKGCVLIAESFGTLKGKPSVMTSKNAPGQGFNEFMDKLSDKGEAYLKIEWYAD